MNKNHKITWYLNECIECVPTPSLIIFLAFLPLNSKPAKYLLLVTVERLVLAVDAAVTEV